MTRWALLAVLLLAAPVLAGSLQEVTFSATSSLSRNSELARRLLSPLTAAKIPQLLAASKRALSDQPVTSGTFAVYVPSQKPPDGYGLLVFVPPWPDARLPQGWDTVLDQAGVIFVSAADSGNTASVLGRREPLAVLAEQNIVQRYPINPARIFIGGFSGGARIAMRLALGYPDVFRGALLDAGSDPIGTATIPLPPRDLFEQFQSGSRLVYLTGGNDLPNLGLAASSKRSMEESCVFHIESDVIADLGHDIGTPAALSRALTELPQPVKPDPDRLAACRAQAEAQLSEALQKVEALIAKGDRDAAHDALTDVDHRYGGLAAPRSLALEQEISRMKP